jgi:hypothetical protein
VQTGFNRNITYTLVLKKRSSLTELPFLSCAGLKRPSKYNWILFKIRFRKVGKWKMLTDGLPTRKRLAEIGLSDVTEDLEKKGKLGDRECPAITELLGKNR